MILREIYRLRKTKELESVRLLDTVMETHKVKKNFFQHEGKCLLEPKKHMKTVA